MISSQAVGCLDILSGTVMPGTRIGGHAFFACECVVKSKDIGRRTHFICKSSADKNFACYERCQVDQIEIISRLIRLSIALADKRGGAVGNGGHAP